MLEQATGGGDANPFRRLAELPALGNDLLTPDEVDTYVRAFEKTGFRGGINWYRNIDRNGELFPTIGTQRLELPCLMVTAEWDVALPPAMAANMPSVCADLEMHNIEACGHWTQQERPAELSRRDDRLAHPTLRGLVGGAIDVPNMTVSMGNNSGLTIGDSISIESEFDPSVVLKVGSAYQWEGIIADLVLGTGNTESPSLAAGLSVPVLTATPQVGDSLISGTAAPGTFVTVFQDFNFVSYPGMLDVIRIGGALVDPSGSFSVLLDAPLNDQVISFGVSPTMDDVSGSGQIASFVQPVPEPSTAVLLGIGLIMVGVRRRPALLRQ